MKFQLTEKQESFFRNDQLGLQFYQKFFDLLASYKVIKNSEELIWAMFWLGRISESDAEELTGKKIEEMVSFFQSLTDQVEV